MRSRPGKVRLKTTPKDLRAAGVLLEDSCAARTLDLKAVFGNSRPVEVEIGPGKGGFLLRRSAEHPETNFLGLEWAPSCAAYVADRAFRAGAVNVRVMAADATEVFRSSLADQSLWRVHVYFPDPWPKRRHRRRRLIQASFLRDVRRVLRIGGWLGIVTDHIEYFNQIAPLVRQMDGMAEAAFAYEPGGEIVGSNFERKYAAEGRESHTIAALRLR